MALELRTEVDLVHLSCTARSASIARADGELLARFPTTTVEVPGFLGAGGIEKVGAEGVIWSELDRRWSPRSRLALPFLRTAPALERDDSITPGLRRGRSRAELVAAGLFLEMLPA
jgi:hypothetical protein